MFSNEGEMRTKKKGRYSKRQQTNYRYPKEKFWIEDCPEFEPSSQPARITVLLTGADLLDNHFHAHQKKEHSFQSSSLQETQNACVVDDLGITASVPTTSSSSHLPGLSPAEATQAVSEALIDHYQSPMSAASDAKGLMIIEKSEDQKPKAFSIYDVKESLASNQKAPSLLLPSPETTNEAQIEKVDTPAAEVSISGSHWETQQLPPPPTPTCAASTSSSCDEVLKIEQSFPSAAAKSMGDYDNDSISISFKRCWSNQNPIGSPPIKQIKKYVPLPNGDCGDGIINPYDKSQVADKYWAQRHRFFSRFDEGIQLDSEGWYSVTPEHIADHVAERMVQQVQQQQQQDPKFTTTTAFCQTTKVANADKVSTDSWVIMDVFCGCGGNVIAFAKRPEVTLVVCVDVDMAKLTILGNNAKIYGIPQEKLLLVHANACTVLEMYRDGNLLESQDDQNIEESQVKEIHGYRFGNQTLLPKHVHSVFLSPPWGGTEYGHVGPRHFSLELIHVKDEKEKEQNGEQLLIHALQAVKHVVYFLPRNTNGLMLATCTAKAGYEGTIEMEQNLLNGKFKTITAYFNLMSRCISQME